MEIRIQHQRTAATSALSPYLPHSQMEAALRMLDDFHLDSPSSTVQFVRALAERFNLPDPLRRRLCIELYDRLDQAPASRQGESTHDWGSPSELHARVERIGENRPQYAAATLPSSAEMLHDLATAFNRWEQTLGPGTARETRQALQAALAQHTGNHAALADWPSRMDMAELGAIPKTELSQLFQQVYSALRDTLGPHGAEALLQRVAHRG